MGLRVSIAAAGMLLGSLPLSVDAAELVILTNQGATPGVRELATAFSQASGHKVTVIQEAGAALERRLNSPAPGDLLTANPEPFDDLIKKGKVVPGTVTPFVLAGLGVSVRAGAPKPDISTVDAYKAALIAAKSIGYSFGCSGTHVADGIEKLGLTEQLKAKTVRTGGAANGGPVTDYLARGDFEIGIQQTNIMVGVAGTDYVGPVPGVINKPCQSNVALLTGSKEPDAARAMIAFMASPAAAPLLRKIHVEPYPR
jgi:molybdate transport system substrate-binding protein